MIEILRELHNGIQNYTEKQPPGRTLLKTLETNSAFQKTTRKYGNIMEKDTKKNLLTGNK